MPLTPNTSSPLIPCDEEASSDASLTAHSGVRPLGCLLPEPVTTRRARLPTTAPSAPSAKDGAAELLSPGACVDGKYIICDVLGEGGSAIVYAAEQVGLRRVVAFKLYPLRAGGSPRQRERFQREAAILARVQHENVVAVYDSGELPDGSPYLVVQRLRGESLGTRLNSGPLPVHEAVDITRQVLRALTALSKLGITHRDVKPDNLVFDLRPDGSRVLKLVDFGIAVLAEGEGPNDGSGELAGTPHYMSPEQLRGEAIDARSDLYSVGVTLYEMLTGRTPHRGDSLNEIAAATLYESITPVRALRPECPEALEQIVMRALARDPQERFPHARAMLKALDTWETQDATSCVATGCPTAPEDAYGEGPSLPDLQADEDVAAASESTPPRVSADLRPFLRRSRAERWGTAAAACLLACSTWMIITHFPPELAHRARLKGEAAAGAQATASFAEPWQQTLAHLGEAARETRDLTVGTGAVIAAWCGHLRDAALALMADAHRALRRGSARADSPSTETAAHDPDAEN